MDPRSPAPGTAGPPVTRRASDVGRRRRMSSAVLSVAAVLTLAGVGASTALAGGYQISASGAAFCSLGGFEDNVPGFSTFCNEDGDSGVIAPGTGAADTDRELFQIASPSGALTITGADALGGYADLADGYGGGTYWSGGGASWTGGASGTDADSGSISSPYWGIQIVCSDADGCAGGASPEVVANGVDLTIGESAGPTLSASGIWNESGAWVWNPAGDSWPPQPHRERPLRRLQHELQRPVRKHSILAHPGSECLRLAAMSELDVELIRRHDLVHRDLGSAAAHDRCRQHGRGSRQVTRSSSMSTTSSPASASFR